MDEFLASLRKPGLQRGYIKGPAPNVVIGLNRVIFDDRAAKCAGRSLWHSNILCVDFKARQGLALR